MGNVWNKNDIHGKIMTEIICKDDLTRDRIRSYLDEGKIAYIEGQVNQTMHVNTRFDSDKEYIKTEIRLKDYDDVFYAFIFCDEKGEHSRYIYDRIMNLETM